jgi:hypothetical protein
MPLLAHSKYEFFNLTFCFVEHFLLLVWIILFETIQTVMLANQASHVLVKPKRLAG